MTGRTPMHNHLVKPALAFLGMVCLASAAAEARTPPVWRFWNMDDGLDESLCSSVTRSPSGEIILGHGDVPNFSILDGHRVSRVPSVHPHAKVYRLPDGRLWSYREMDGETGFGVFHPDDNRWDFHPVPGLRAVLPRLPSYYAPAGPESMYFLALDGSVKRWAIDGGRPATVIRPEEAGLGGFTGGPIPSIAGGAWIAALSGAVRVTDGGWKAFPFPPGMERAPGMMIEAPAESASPVLYSPARPPGGDRARLAALGGGVWEWAYRADGADISGGWLDEEGGAWLGVDGRLAMGDGRGGIRRMGGGGTLSSQVFDVLLLDGGVFWLATYGGAARHAPSPWRTPQALETFRDPVHKLCVDADGALWFIADARLIRFDGENTETVPMPVPVEIIYADSLIQMADGRLVAGARGAALYLYDPANRRFDAAEHPSRAIQHVYPRDGASVWVTTAGPGRGVITFEIFDGTTFERVFDNRNGPSIPVTRDVVETRNGDVWIGHYLETGPILWRDGSFATFGPEDGYGDLGAFQYLELEDGRVWASGRSSIHEFNGERWTPVKQGVDRTFNMTAASDGSVWVASKSGLARYRGGSWVTLTAEDGLPSTMVHNIIEDTNGVLWAASLEGVFRYYPEADSGPPETWIREEANAREIAPGGQAGFVLGGADQWKFTPAERLLYSWRVDGGEWTPFRPGGAISIPNPPPGQHALYARAMDRNWNIDPTPAEWTFTVLYPWHQEPRFQLIAAAGTLVIAALAWMAARRHILLMRANAGLHSANERLRELDKLKTAFVSQASHDLRSPLTAIKGSLDNLMMGIAGELNGHQARVLDRAVKSVERLSDLVNDVLDLSRIESGRVTLDKRRVDFAALAEGILREEAPLAAEKSIRLEFNRPDGECPADADAAKMERVAGELISNAIKYTHEGGTVEVRAERGDGCVRLVVRDNGIGMTADELNNIWERFYRAPGAKVAAKGSGLGLSIAKELTELHGGTLTAESAPGRGSVFTLTLPAGD